MDKFLFTDGINGVREAHSKKQLLSLVHSAADPDTIRIWIFSSHEWTDYPSFLRQHPGFEKDEKRPVLNVIADGTAGRSGVRSWMKRSFFFIVVLTGALLVFNFTSAGWEPVTPLRTEAARPANVPVMDMDSLVREIEALRSRPIDKNTRNNLRLRNNWPDFIFLRLQAEKEVKGITTRFIKVEISIDNATGFMIDQASVQLQLWKNGKASPADTLQFSDMRYDKMQVRRLDRIYRCDSISVSFRKIRSKAFNFCYADGTGNPSSNQNDQWFCREGKIRE